MSRGTTAPFPSSKSMIVDMSLSLTSSWLGRLEASFCSPTATLLTRTAKSLYRSEVILSRSASSSYFHDVQFHILRVLTTDPRNSVHLWIGANCPSRYFRSLSPNWHKIMHIMDNAECISWRCHCRDILEIVVNKMVRGLRLCCNLYFNFSFRSETNFHVHCS